MTKRWEQMTDDEKMADCRERILARRAELGQEPTIQDPLVLAKVARLVQGADLEGTSGG